MDQEEPRCRAVDFKIEDSDEAITVYTTRPDTLHGATFMVLAPEHKLAAELATDETREAVEEYIYQASLKSSVDRLQDKEKTGVFTGSYAVNPINGKKVPIWLSDYVLADYGTGAIMCVPAHDDRDFEFATKFNIPIVQVIAKDGKEIENMTEAYTEAAGTMINSGDWNGMESSVLKEEAPAIIEKMGVGKKTTNYKLRDWVFSRQRYWGEPIRSFTVRTAQSAGASEELPLTLPEVEKYEPTGTGESRLQTLMNGSTQPVLSVENRLRERRILCRSGRDHPGIFCDISTARTVKNWFPKKKRTNTCRLICISAV